MEILLQESPTTESSPLSPTNLSRGDNTNSETIPPPAMATQKVPTQVQKSSESNASLQKLRIVGGIPFLVDDSSFEMHQLRNPAIAIIGCSRLDSIITSLSNLLKLKGVEAFTIYVSLGCPRSVSHSVFVKSASNLLAQRKKVNVIEFNDVSLSPTAAPFLRIHRHYIHLLRLLFEDNNHSHVLLLEDDLLVSPTALSFIKQTAVILDRDPSLLCISLFNDNAYAENPDPTIVRRGSHFPNLGMFFNLEGYRVWNVSQVSFTTNGWDHWLRTRAEELGLECLFPSLPRVLHQKNSIGTTVKQGDHSNLHMMPFSKDMHDIDLGNLSYLFASNYDQSIARLFSDQSTKDDVLNNLNHSLSDFVTGKKYYDVSVNARLSWSNLAHNLGYKENEIIILSFRNDSSLMKIQSNSQVKLIVILITEEYYSQYASILRISKSPRCMHKGILFIQYKGIPVILLNRREAWSLLPISDAVFFNQHSQLVTTKLDETCIEACKRVSTDTTHYVCEENQLQFLNHCEVIRQFFPCEKGCEHEVGQDLPAYVNSSGVNSNGLCLFSTDVQPICDFSIQVTQRLCTCTDANTIVKYGFTPSVLSVTRKAQMNMRSRKHQ